MFLLPMTFHPRSGRRSWSCCILLRID